MSATLFWVSVLALLYGYLGYPLLVALVGGIRDRKVRRAPVTPSMTLIIAAYNEEEAIAGRLDNALSVDYPRNHSRYSWSRTVPRTERPA